MYDILAWLEASGLGRTIRGSGVWAYAVINLTHILGVAALFGSILVLDLRLLGLWRDLPLGVLAPPTVRLAGAGFAVALLSGICMLSTNATEYAGNPFLIIKFPAIALGLANVAVLRHMPEWNAIRRGQALRTASRRRLAAAGGLSLVCWLTALTAGRMIAYW